MRKLLLLLLLSYSSIFAQNPFGKNANWTYSVNSMMEGWGLAHIYHHKDTVINGETFQIIHDLKRTINRTGPNPGDISNHLDGIINTYHLLTRNDSVFSCNTDGSIDALLYDFNAQIGDTVFFREAPNTSSFPDCTSRPGYIITAIGIDTIDGEPLDYWDFDTIYLGGEFFEPGRLYRDLGVLNAHFITLLHPCTYSTIEYSKYTFRCFWNDSIHIQDLNWGKECEFFSGVSVDLYSDITLYAIYPNPVQDVLYIDFHGAAKPASITITDLQGRCVSNELIMNENLHIASVEQLSAGMYILNLLDENGVLMTQRRIVKK